MTVRAPAAVGMRLEEVDTPALILDLEAFETNLKRLSNAVSGRVRVRAHAKTHKCPEIARRQVAAGAVGVCCQKVSEAEAMVEGGIADVLVSNEVVGRGKLERLAALAKRARLGVCADDAENVRELESAMKRAGARIDVHVELEIGMHRCGVAPGEPAVALARAIADLAIVDAGLKASSVDSGMPGVWQRPGLAYTRASDEHGWVEIAAGAAPPGLGDKLLLVPGHCDPTVNLYDWYVCVRGGVVEALWPITARGALY